MARGDIWYRIEDRRRAGPTDECGNGTAAVTSAVLREFKVLHETGFTVTLTDGVETVTRHKRRTVGWAQPTVEGALEAFYKRKQSQKTRLNSLIRHIDDAVEYARRGQMNRIKLPTEEK